MSIESHLASQGKKKPTFREVAGKLLSEKESKGSRPWKWEDEVRPTDIKLMVKALDEYKERQDWHLFFDTANTIKILDPSFIIQLSESEWNDVERLLIADKKTTGYNFFQLASAIHLFDPNKSLNLKEGDWEFMENALDHYVEFEIWSNVFELATNMCILDPNRRSLINEETLRKMNEYLDRFKKKSKAKGLIAAGWETFGYYAMLMRIFNQDHNFLVDASAWDEMKEELESLRGETLVGSRFVGFGTLAKSMRILAAYKVEVTKDGIIITDDPPEKLDVTTPPRPTRKKMK